MSIPDLGIDFDRLTSDLGNDLGDVFGKVATQARGGLERIANVAQRTSTGLERIAPAGGGPNNLARIAGYGAYGGGGSGLDFFDTLGGSNPFAAFEQAAANLAAQPTLPEPQTPAGSPTSGGSGVGAAGAQGSWGVHENYRELLTRVAQEYGLDPDEVAAFAQIETGHLPAEQVAGATSSAGAMGILQVMPFHFKPGQNGYDPETNVRVGLAFYKQMRDRFGPGLAAAAYHGGPGAIVNGRARDDNSDGHMTSAQYAAQWQKNYDRIKATAPPQATGAGYAGSAEGVASLYGGTVPPITQAFGRTDFSTGSGSGIYDFGSEMGLDGDSHTGWDVGSAVGTKFYMPKGLSGTVTIAGCTQAGCYYTDEQRGAGEGRGELRIKLDNGYELILGHNSAINVKPGDRVTAGMLLGLTGYANGAHQHVEVRVPDRSTASGWRIVDPSVLFGNAR